MNPLLYANMNRMSMNGYSGFFDRPENQGQEDSYRAVRDWISQTKGTVADEALADFRLRTMDVGTLSQPISQVESGVGQLADMMQRKQGTIYAFDMETLGDYATAKTQSDLFAVTELAITQKTLQDGRVGVTQNVLLGLNSQQSAAYNQLFQKAQVDFNSLTPAERSTMERLARYGADDTVIKNVGGIHRLERLGTASPMDIQAASRGYQTLMRVGKTQGWGTDYAQKELRDAAHLFSGMTGPDKMLVTHNGSVFDVPVYNKALEIHNISSQVRSDAINHMDFRTAYHVAHAGGLAGAHERARTAAGIEEGAGGGLETLETIANSHGIKTDSHIGFNDTLTSLSLLDAETMSNGQKIPMWKDLQNRITERTGSYNTDLTPQSMGRTVIHARTAVGTKGLDSVGDASRDWPLNRNYFYKLTGIGKVSGADPDTLRKIGANRAATSQELYYMTLRNAAFGMENDEVTVVRESMDELQELFQRNLETLDLLDEVVDPTVSPEMNLLRVNRAIANKQVSQGIIDFNTQQVRTDAVRRQFEGLFQTSGKGFDYAKTLYGTVDALSEMGVTDLDQARAILDAPPDDPRFKGLYRRTGELIPERRRDVLDMFNLLSDTKQTMGDMIQHIDANMPEASQVEKTVVLGRAYERMQARLAEDLNVASDIARNRKLTASILMDKDVMEIAGTSIRTRSVDEARYGLLNLASQMAGNTKNKRQRERIQYEGLRKLAKEIYGENHVKMQSLFSQLNSPFAIADTMAGDLNERYVNEILVNRSSVTAFDVSGYKVDTGNGVKNLDRHMTDRAMAGSMFARDAMTDVSGTHVRMGMHLQRIDGKIVAQDSRIRSVLQDVHGWSENNVNEFFRGLYGSSSNPSYGWISGHGMSASLFEDDEGRLKLAVGKSDERSVTRLYEAMASGSEEEIRKVAAVTELPSVRRQDPLNSGSIRMAQIGNTVKNITGEINAYAYDGDIHFGNRDIVDEALNALTKTHRYIPDLIAAGDNERASSLLQRAVSAPVFGASGFSGTTTVQNDAGLFSKKLLPNVADFRTSGDVNVSGLINYLPELYQDYEDIRKDMSNVRINGKDINQKTMNDWLSEIMNGQLRDFDKAGVEMQEWFTMNLFEGKRIIERIHKRVSLKGEAFKSEAQEISRLISEGYTMINKPERVPYAIASKGTAFEWTPFGFMNELARPVAGQGLSFHAISPEMANQTRQSLLGQNIRIGQSVTTENMENYVAKTGLEPGVTATMKRMTDREILERIEELDGTGNTAWAREMKIKYGAHEYRKMIDSYRTVASTHQQHAMINPTLAGELYPQMNLRSWADGGEGFRLNDDISQGSFVKDGDVIGSNVNGAVKYRGVSGTVSDIEFMLNDRTKLQVLPDKKSIEDIKVVIGGVEKAVASPAGLSNAAFSQEVWDGIFGKGIGLVGHFEVGKHEAASLVYGSSIMRAAERAMDLGQEEAFTQLMKTHLPSWNARFNNGRMVISGNPNATGGHFSGIKGLIGSLGTGYEDIVSSFNDPNNREIRAVLSKGQMAEEFSSMADQFDDGKGLKVTGRLLQVAGSQQGDKIDDFYTTGPDGRLQKRLQPLLDQWEGEIARDYKPGTRELSNYGKARRDIGNIMGVSETLQGKGTTRNIATMDYRDVQPTLRGVDASMLPDALQGTAFGTDADILRINLPDDMTVMNPLSGKRESSILVPQLSSYEINGMTVTHKAHRDTADLLRTIDQLLEGKIPRKTGGINNLQVALDQSYAKAINGYLFEMTDAKKSILSEHMLSGRLAHSGQALVGAIHSPDLLQDGVSPLLRGIIAEDVVQRVGGKTIYKDVAYSSRSFMENLGVDFAEIGRQVAVSKNFRNEIGIDVANGIVQRSGVDLSALPGIGDIKALRAMIDSPDGTESKAMREEAQRVLDALDMIGSQYARDRGINGMMVRYPSFLESSMMAVNMRLNDNIKGEKVHLMSWMGQKMNADVDADRISFVANLSKRGSIKSIKDKGEAALRSVFEAQSRNNYRAQQASADSYAKVDPNGINAHSVPGFDRYMTEVTSKKLGEGYDNWEDFDARSNRLSDPARRSTAVKAGADKAGIGYISNVGVTLRDIAEEQFLNNRNQADKRNIMQFTERAEQKLIDVKHIKAIGADSVIQSDRFMRVVGAMATGTAKDRQLGQELLKEIMLRTGTYSSDETERLNEVVGSVSRMFDTATARQQWMNPMRDKGTDKGLQKIAEAVSGDLSVLGETENTRRAARALQSAKDAGQDVGDFAKDLSSKRVYVKEAAGGMPVPIGAYQVSGRGVGRNSGQTFVELRSQLDGRFHRVYGEDLRTLRGQFAKDFKGAEGLSSEDVLQLQTAEIEARAMKDGQNFERERLLSQYAKRSGDQAGAPELRQSVLGGSLLDVNARDDVMDSMNRIDASSEARAAYARANDLFFENKETGVPMRRFAAATAVMQEQKYIGDPGSLITSFNNEIRRRAGSKNWGPQEIQQTQDAVLRAQLQRTSGLPSGQIPAILGSISQKADSLLSGQTGMSYPRPAATGNVTEILEEIGKNPVYDEGRIQSLLSEEAARTRARWTPDRIASSSREAGLSPEEFQSRLNSSLERTNVQLPMEQIRRFQNERVEKLNQLYTQLMTIGTEEDKQRLGLTGNEYQSKVTYGPLAGVEFKDLTLEERGSILSMTAKDGASAAEQINVDNLRSRMNQYITNLDQTSKSFINKSHVNQTGVSRPRGGDVNLEGLFQSTGARVQSADSILSEVMSQTKKMNLNMARDTIKETIGSRPAVSLNALESSKWGRVALGAAAVGLAGMMIGQFTAKPAVLEPVHKNPGYGGSPDPNGRYDRPSVAFVEPKTDNGKRTPPMTEDRHGMRLKVSGRNATNNDNARIASMISEATERSLPQRMNVDITSQDDTSGVSDDWLGTQFKRLLGG